MTDAMKIPIQDKRKMAIQTALLRTLYIGGMLTVAILAPKVMKLIGSPDRAKAKRQELYGRINAARSRLKQRGLVREDDNGRIKLTKQGEAHIERVLMREYEIPEPVLWNGKWHILSFDIHERRRRVRSQLRSLLQGAGFVRLQDSVWVHPYPCDEFVALVRAHLSSGVGELRHITADALESDRALRDHFRLP
ncbi:CRISPR-associated endonuclease Cas2 [bacterium]|nr:MAG: CRISPR-associated endonuclease Cas2 [bacterium]